MQKKIRKILICPLDWGLGHATRCIPIITELQKRGIEIFIGSSGSALHLLKQEFPTLTFLELPSYRPVYPATGPMPVTMLSQIPKFRKVISEEHDATEQFIHQHGVDCVISDNRYGCWSSKVKSVFITHQTHLKMPKGFGWISRTTNFFINRYIDKFSEVWIPDQPDSELTKPFVLRNNPNQKYIGWLSRFEPGNTPELKYEIIALISGPEPQRTIFERLLMTELKSMNAKALVVSGEPDRAYRKQVDTIEMVNHLPAAELRDAILSSQIVVSRSGYSTVMDMIALGKKAVFVPTPQQPEQIFLARFLHEKKIAFTMDQTKLTLKHALEKSQHCSGFSVFKHDDRYLKTAIENLLV